MQYLGMPQEALEKSGGYWTAREISQQPVVWAEIGRLMAHDADLESYLGPLLRRKELRIVLTGAGTSAFIGECLAPSLSHRTGLRADAVASTDLVASPERWLTPAAPTLLISFARSGNSPESIAALDLAHQIVPECHHLIVTCNREGALFRRGQSLPNSRVVLLPDETNDRGFAMTSSFSGMMLACALVFGLLQEEAGPAAIAQWAGQMLDAGLPLISSLAHAGFERVIYLGSKELKGLARESALKMLELSDGRVVALSDTPLGFRHGPKTIVNGKTLVVLFMSNDPYTRRFEVDVHRELRADGVAARVVALTAEDPANSSQDTLTVRGASTASDLGLCFPYAAFAQTLAFLQSLALGLRPDMPNARGVVNRVVQGVTIYPWNFRG